VFFGLFDRSLVEGRLIGEFFDFVVGLARGTFLEHFSFGFVGRSFVAHLPLPIHRSSRSVAS
jgi:hypothetical protein